LTHHSLLTPVGARIWRPVFIFVHKRKTNESLSAE
jgi:hypothetical protein